jgi:hypothetical protein
MMIIDIVWNLPRLKPVPTRHLEQIDGVAIHHSGDEGNPDSWATYHTRPPDKGGPSWGPGATIGYHAAVMRSGLAYKTAYDGDQTPGVAGHNHHLLHVVCQGSLGVRPITEEQFASLLWVVRRYASAYAIPPDQVRTHGEWQTDPAWATACPGIGYLGALVRGALKA